MKSQTCKPTQIHLDKSALYIRYADSHFIVLYTKLPIDIRYAKQTKVNER